jgi:hypothetical protein
MQLTWTAPADGSGNVSGYQIRYAKVPITSANFDDTSVTTAVTYTGTPATAGQLDGIAVTGLTIETDYYFAIEASDVAGSKSAIVPTPSAVTAHFNVTTVTGTSGLSNEQFGIQFDGSGDVNGDGRSDILVGSSNGQRAYLFFGTASTFNPSAPSVVFTGDGTTSSFGRGVAEIGDIDKDGREDIAIASLGSSPPRILIYKGRDNWPLTMAPSDADYVITGDSTYIGSALGVSMARLGDFNGDGVDDFAIGASGFTVGAAYGVGRVVVVLGKSGFGNITLPDTTNTITITGDSSLSFPFFGASVVGLGHFYSVTTGTTLVVSAPGVAGLDSSSGRLYAFHGQAGSGGSITLTSRDNLVVGPAGSAGIGAVLTNLGPMVNGLPSVGSGNPGDTATAASVTGSTYVFDGTSAAGPFSAQIALNRAGNGKFGQAVIGGGVSGRNTSYSILSDSRPDLVVASQNSSTFTILDGNTVAGLGAGPTDAGTAASVTLSQPFSVGQGEGQLFPDLNGDGYPDFALGSALNAVPGSLAVYW